MNYSSDNNSGGKKPLALNSGHRARLRERFLMSSLDGMLDYEILELLLTYAIPRRDVKPLAKEIIAELGSLKNLLYAEQEQLLALPGVTENSATLFLLIRALCTKYLEFEAKGQSIKLTTAPQVVNFARMKIGSAQRETLMSIFMNSSNQVLAFEFSDGTIDHAEVYVRELVRKCLDANATGLILLHNHPSGNCRPSPEDIDVTRSLRTTLQPIGIRLLDHLIITPREYYSMESSGLFREQKI